MKKQFGYSKSISGFTDRSGYLPWTAFDGDCCHSRSEPCVAVLWPIRSVTSGRCLRLRRERSLGQRCAAGCVPCRRGGRSSSKTEYCPCWWKGRNTFIKGRNNMAHKLDSKKSSGKRPQPFTAMYAPAWRLATVRRCMRLICWDWHFRTMNRSCVLRKMMPAALMRFKRFLDAASERAIYCSICAANRHFRSIIGKPESLSALSWKQSRATWRGKKRSTIIIAAQMMKCLMLRKQKSGYRSRLEFLIPMSVIAVVRQLVQTGFGCPETKSCAWTAMRRMTDLTFERFSVDHNMTLYSLDRQ